MTPEQEDALIERATYGWYSCDEMREQIRLAIRAAVAAERERCAKVCMDRAREAMNETGDYRLGRAYMDACVHCAHGIMK